MTTSSRCHLSPAQGSPTTDLVGERLAELEGPLPHRLVADENVASRQHLLDHAQAQREPEIQPDRVADDFGRKPVAGVAGRCELAHRARLPAAISEGKPNAGKLTVPFSEHR